MLLVRIAPLILVAMAMRGSTCQPCALIASISGLHFILFHLYGLFYVLIMSERKLCYVYVGYMGNGGLGCAIGSNCVY